MTLAFKGKFFARSFAVFFLRLSGVDFAMLDFLAWFGFLLCFFWDLGFFVGLFFSGFEEKNC